MRRDLLKRSARGVLWAALGLALLPAAAAADPCDTNPVACAQAGDEPIPMQARVLATILPVRDGPAATALYRSLIPAPFEMPTVPQVGIYLEKLGVPQQIPEDPDGTYSNWMEGGLDIRVINPSTKELGWYRLSVPVSSSFEYTIGRDAGFPKGMADMTTTQTASGWLMRSTFPTGGRTDQTLSFTPTPKSTVAGELDRYALNKDPIFLLNTPLKGPSAVRYRFIVTPIVPASDFGAPGQAQFAPLSALPAPQAGSITYTIDPRPDQLAPDLRQLFGGPLGDLGTLIPLHGTVPGAMFSSQIEWVFLQSQSDGSGGYR